MGIVGILYILIKAVLTFKTLREDKKLLDKLELTLEHIVYQLKQQDGKLTLNEGSQEYVVNFSEGTPGVIPLLSAAADLFPHLADDLIELAI